jgi:hypothetical protein
MAQGGYFYRVKRKVTFLMRRGSFYPSSRRKDIPERTVFHKIFVNSLFAFLLAYVFVYLVFNLTILLSAAAFNIPTLLSYAEISYIVKGTGWTSDAVKIIFSSGPFIMLLLGTVMLFLYQYVSHETGILKLVVLWIYSLSIVQCLGEITVGSLLGEGFGYVLMYMYVNDTMVLVITVLALCGMVAAGVLSTRQYLVSANSYFNDLPHRLNRKFLVFQFLFPFVAGNIIIYLVKLPGITLYELFVNATMVFVLLPVIIRGGTMADFYFDEEPRQVKLVFPMILASIIVLILFRLVLNSGLRILM